MKIIDYIIFLFIIIFSLLVVYVTLYADKRFLGEYKVSDKGCGPGEDHSCYYNFYLDSEDIIYYLKDGKRVYINDCQ